jgi:lipopolysaccharide cholinephosphotransferase
MTYNDYVKESCDYYLKIICEKGRQYQSDLLSIMNAFHNACEKVNITYFMGYGTLLGAVRDGGLIPWDFDMDLLVRYSDKERLIEALSNNLDSGFSFICREKDKFFEHFDMRIVKRGVHHQILHVDVFYLLNAPDSKNAFEKYSKRLIKLANIRYYKLVDTNMVTTSKIARAKYTIKKLEYCMVPVSLVNALHERLCTKYTDNETEYYFRTCMSMRNTKYMYPKKWFSEAHLISFGEYQFYAPCCTEEFLRMFYRDYSKYPSMDKRFDEFIIRINLRDSYIEKGLYETEETK